MFNKKGQYHKFSTGTCRSMHFEASATPSMNNHYDYDFQKKTKTDLQAMHGDSTGDRYRDISLGKFLTG